MKEDFLLLKQIEIGLDARQFLEKSNLGHAIRQQAIDYEREALLELAACDPNNAGEVLRLQTKAKTPALALEWLLNIINQGENAENLMQQSTYN